MEHPDSYYDYQLNKIKNQVEGHFSVFKNIIQEELFITSDIVKYLYQS